MCPECGSEDVQIYPRFAVIGEILRRLMLAGGAVALGLGVVRSTNLWIALAVVIVALAVALPHAGVRYWGGMRCRACGHVLLAR